MLKEISKGLCVCVLIAALMMIGCAELGNSLETSRSATSKQSFLVSDTTVESCLEILAELGLGQAVKGLPNMLEVTGTAEDLRRVATVMWLIDTNEPYAVETLGPISRVRGMPSNDVIARRLQVTVGTFAQPPAARGSTVVLIDLLDTRVIAIGPRQLMPQIKRAVAAGPSEFLASFEDRNLDEDYKETSLAAQEPVTGAVPIPRDPKDAGKVTEHDNLTNESGDQADTADQERSAASAESNLDVGREEGTPDRVPQVTPMDGATGPGQAPTTTVIRATTQPRPTTHRRPIKPVVLENGDDIVELTLPESLSLIELLDLVGEYLDLDYLYDPAQIHDQPLTLKLHGKLQGDLRVRDLYSLLETVLKFKGLAMTRGRDDLVAIVPLADALDVDPELIDSTMDGRSAGDMVVTRVFHLEHIAPSEAVELLEEMKLGVAMTPVEETRVLFVTCYAHRLERIEYLLSLIDQPGEPRALAIRTLQYTLAGPIAEKVQTLAQELNGMTVSLAEPARSGRGSSPTEPAKGSGQAVFLDTDERTNRILMIGRDEQLALVQRLVDTLDVQQRDLRTLQVYTIDFAEASEVVFKLAELGAIADDSASPGVSRRGGPNARNEEALADAPSEQPRVVVLEATNSLLIFATAEQHGQIKQIIGHVDVSAVDLRTSLVYTIHHVDALDVEAKLQSLGLIASGTQAPQQATRITGAKPALRTSTPAEAAEPSGTRAVVLEARNALLVHATDEVHERIKRIVDLVDVQPSAQSIPYEIYFLETQAPEQLADILTRIVQETIVDSEGKVEQTIARMEDQIIIVPGASTFSLIVYASRKHQE